MADSPTFAQQFGAALSRKGQSKLDFAMFKAQLDAKARERAEEELAELVAHERAMERMKLGSTLRTEEQLNPETRAQDVLGDYRSKYANFPALYGLGMSPTAPATEQLGFLAEASKPSIQEGGLFSGARLGEAQWKPRMKGEDEVLTGVDQLNALRWLGEQYGPEGVRAGAEMLGIDPGQFAELGPNVRQTREEGVQTRWEQDYELKLGKQGFAVAKYYIDLIADKGFDPETARIFGGLAWRELMEKKLIPTGMPEPDWSRVAETPGDKAKAFYDIFDATMKAVELGFDVGKAYAAEGEEPPPTIDVQPVNPFSLAAPGFSVPSAQGKAISIPVQKVPPKKAQAAAMTAGNRDKARRYGFNEAAISTDPGGVMRKIAFYERKNAEATGGKEKALTPSYRDWARRYGFSEAAMDAEPGMVVRKLSWYDRKEWTREDKQCRDDVTAFNKEVGKKKAVSGAWSEEAQRKDVEAFNKKLGGKKRATAADFSKKAMGEIQEYLRAYPNDTWEQFWSTIQKTHPGWSKQASYDAYLTIRKGSRK